MAPPTNFFMQPLKGGSVVVRWIALLTLSAIAFAAWRGIYSTGLADGVAILGEGDGRPCRPTNVSIAASANVLNAFIQVAVIPALLAETNRMVVPPQELEHVWVDAMVLQHFRVETLKVDTGSPTERSLTWWGTGVGLEVDKSRFIFSYLGVKCYGTFWATLNSTDVHAVMDLTLQPEGYWNVTFPLLKLSWGILDVHHQLDSKTCGMAEKVVELFLGELDRFVAEKVKAQLDKDAPSKVADGINALFRNVSVRALTPPVMTRTRMAVTLNGNLASFGCSPPTPGTSVPPLLERDIALRTSPSHLNNFLSNAFDAEVLRFEWDLPYSMNTSLLADILPEVYEACPECGLYTLVQAAAPPVLRVPQPAEVSVAVENLGLGLYVVPRTEWQRASLLPKLAKVSAVASTELVALEDLPGFTTGTPPPGNAEAIPLLALRCSATFGAGNLTIDAGRYVYFGVREVHDLHVTVEASNVGEVNTREVEEKSMQVWNGIAAPLLNTFSPFKLPFFLRKAELYVREDDVEFGVSIGLVQDLVAFFQRFQAHPYRSLIPVFRAARQ